MWPIWQGWGGQAVVQVCVWLTWVSVCYSGCLPRPWSYFARCPADGARVPPDVRILGFSNDSLVPN